ncbi:hypothetical protein L596_021111 [Steinernema carpocapsae]|uniref:Uncharacterized protein n=1 Tax=Steinernema carpocapsae TaxID=34508 RepID=A0A4U5MVI4_STECR|nr:hypothetical protein L596_021111 [Steinernema carpocapsae]
MIPRGRALALITKDLHINLSPRRKSCGASRALPIQSSSCIPHVSSPIPERAQSQSRFPFPGAVVKVAAATRFQQLFSTGNRRRWLPHPLFKNPLIRSCGRLRRRLLPVVVVCVMMMVRIFQGEPVARNRRSDDDATSES